ncbi:ribosome biogenesis protein SLX9-domain-containing protein [Kalaharituber pfeilii]|nr:ribosome biogenesis protein SLX9-domain-containing protein [Kalaharituber pfeilii]
MARNDLRAKARAAAAAGPSPSTAAKSHPARPPTIQSTKKDKRLARHEALLSKVASSAAVTKSSRKNAKRRDARVAKQNLITGLTSLAEALPDASEDGEDEDHVFSEGGREAIASLQTGKMKMNTIKSKPGAQKKKEKLLRDECERFGKNLAVMTTALAAKARDKGETVTWAALRGFIENTMERKEEFVKVDNVTVQKEEGGMEVD